MKNFIVAVKQEVSNQVAVVAAGQGHAVAAAVHHAVEAGVAAEVGVVAGPLAVAAGVPVAAEVHLQPGVITAVTVTEERRTRKKSLDLPAVLMRIKGGGGSEIFEFKANGHVVPFQQVVDMMLQKVFAKTFIGKILYEMF